MEIRELPTFEIGLPSVVHESERLLWSAFLTRN